MYSLIDNGRDAYTYTVASLMTEQNCCVEKLASYLAVTITPIIYTDYIITYIMWWHTSYSYILSLASTTVLVRRLLVLVIDKS